MPPSIPSAVQAQERDYAFHTLGWYQFQKLCQTILTDILGQTVQVFSPGRDGGRDAAFSGSWSQCGTEDLSGTFTFQVKYSKRQYVSLAGADLEEEIYKARELFAKGLAENYIVITNYTHGGKTDEDVASWLKAEIGCRAVKIFGSDWLSSQIRDNSHLRMLVPRVYGLGDLGEILDQRAYEQAKAIISWMPALKTIVTTDAMQCAARVLREHRFVFLVGDPMVGKTTAASSLALAALDDMRLRVLKLRSAPEFAQHWNATREAKQFIWIDDAFGETAFDEELCRDWGRHLDVLGAALECGACVVMTSRSYIWEQAKGTIKTYSFEPFQTNKVVIRLADLTQLERSEMLYNHLRMGDQTVNFRRTVKPLLPALANVEPFYPEAARRLASSRYTSALRLDAYSLTEYFRSPNDILVDVLTRLSSAEKAVLALIFSNNGQIGYPLAFDKAASDTIARFWSTDSDVMRAIGPMEGVFVKLVTTLDGGTTYRFFHPSISDAMSTMAASRREWLDVFLAGASNLAVFKLTHAGRAVKGVEIEVPKTRFSEIIERIRASAIEAYIGSEWTRYLAYRCGADFLNAVTDAIPYVFDERYYDTDEQIPRSDDYLNLCAALRSYGMLSEKHRRAAVTRIEHLLSSDVSIFEWDHFKNILTDKERESIHLSLKAEPSKYLRDMHDRLNDSYSDGLDPEDVYGEGFNYIDEFEEVFPGDERVRAACEAARSRLAEEIDEKKASMKEPRQDEDVHDFRFASRHSSEAHSLERSIFSDVDDEN